MGNSLFSKAVGRSVLLLSLSLNLVFSVLALCLPLVIFENQVSIVAVLGVRNELVSLHDTLLDDLVQGNRFGHSATR